MLSTTYRNGVTMVDVTNKGNAAWQALEAGVSRRGKMRTQKSLELEATIRDALNRFDDGTVSGVWIDPIRGEPIWIGPAINYEDNPDANDSTD
jgi:hypothetical protein